MSKLLNQTGMSIVQGMILAAVIAGSALVATRIMTDQKASMKSVETRDQIEQLHNMIFGMLQNREHCTATIAQNSLNATNNYNRDIERSINSIWAKNSTAPAFRTYDGTTNTVYMNNNVSISGIKMIYPKSPNTLASPATLRVTYNRLEGSDPTKTTRTKSGVGAKSINRDILIMMQFTGAGPATIRSCYAVQALREGDINDPKTVNEEFCKSLGVEGSLFTWDPNTNTCALRDNVCDSDHIFEGIDSNGLAICRTVDFYLNFLLDPTAPPCTPPFTNVRFVMGSGGLKIQCN